MSYDSDMTFTLGRNNKGNNPKRPDFRGEMRLGGKIYDLSAWIRTNTTKGTKFFSGRVQERVPKAPQQGGSGFEVEQTPAPTTPKPSIEDDIPL